MKHKSAVIAAFVAVLTILIGGVVDTADASHRRHRHPVVVCPCRPTPGHNVVRPTPAPENPNPTTRPEQPGYDGPDPVATPRPGDPTPTPRDN